MLRFSSKKKVLQNGSHESMDSQLSSSSNENLSHSTKEGKDGIDKILHQRIVFKVYYLGVVQEINITNSKKRDTDAQLIDLIEEHQIDGKLEVAAKEENTVQFFVSRYGIKVVSGNEVLQRHPLHTIAQLIQYSDGFNRQNIAVKIGQVGKNVYQCYLFQCNNEIQAQGICQCVRLIFDAITAKS